MSPELLLLVKWFIIFEFIVVAAFVLATYGIRLFFLTYKRLDHRLKQKIDAAFLSMMQTGVVKTLPFRSHPALLVTTFMSWDKAHKDSVPWLQIRMAIMQKGILPHASAFSKSRMWTHRYWVVQCFHYYIDTSYQNILIKLIFDKFSVVSISCTDIALKTNEKSVVQALINKICAEHDHIQALYITKMQRTPLVYEVIYKKLQNTHHIRAKLACYRMLQQIRPTKKFYSIAHHDLYHTNLDLRLAAIRILAQADPIAATTPLLILLDDPNWIVRNTVIQHIEALPEDDILKALNKAVDDESWWVRMNAAKVLSGMGEKGLALLEKNSHLHHLHTLKEPAYFLKIHNMLSGGHHD